MRLCTSVLLALWVGSGCAQSIIAPAGPSDARPRGGDAGRSSLRDATADAGSLDDAGPLDAAAPDAVAADAIAFDAQTTFPDATTDFPDARTGFPDAAAIVHPDATAPLDPALSLPDPSGQPCTTPGARFECPQLEICRPFTATEGRCESCGPCGNLSAPCTRSDECDILFTCFRGQCTGFCQLGGFGCGLPSDCIDVGLANMYGVCAPR